MLFRVECTHCSFEKTMTDVDEIYDAMEAHRDANGERHFFEFERVEVQPVSA